MPITDTDILRGQADQKKIDRLKLVLENEGFDSLQFKRNENGEVVIYTGLGGAEFQAFLRGDE